MSWVQIADPYLILYIDILIWIQSHACQAMCLIGLMLATFSNEHKFLCQGISVLSDEGYCIIGPQYSTKSFPTSCENVRMRASNVSHENFNVQLSDPLVCREKKPSSIHQ